jgi:diacylglycerol kinase family enzyme
VALQAEAQAIPTDVIRCGGNYALNYCAIGIESATAIQIQKWHKHVENYRRRFHWITALFLNLAAIRTIFNKTIMNQYYTIIADGEDLSGSYALINIANGPCYAYDKNPVITAVPDDGFLDMLLLKSVPLPLVLFLIGPYLKGKYAEYPKYFIWRRVKKVSVYSESPLFVNMDGETFFDSELTCEIIPGAIKVAAVNGLSYHVRAVPHV